MNTFPTNIGAGLAFVVATAGLAGAQTMKRSTVYTNVIDGQRGAIVKEVRDVEVRKPHIPEWMLVPVPVFTKAEMARLQMGPTSYVPRPPQQVQGLRAESVRPRRRQAEPMSSAPLFIDGLYVGPSPSGQWTSITHTEPTVNVNILGRRRQRE
ncbi:MAG: hypothetical protein Q8T13_19865 [Acidobacteriota bacterium]|nr:hypothetical protein [Acidobacteriota bacterium]